MTLQGRKMSQQQVKHRTMTQLILGAILTVFLPPISVIAQESQALENDELSVLDEITVTARRVEESLQKIPISVSAFQGDQLEALNITTVGDTAWYTPNFTTITGPTGQNDAFFFIRGIGQADLNAATDPGVGTYVDGVYLGRVVGASLETLDLKMIEILRGPQGTLFGRNSTSGAVNITTADPAEELSGGFIFATGERDLIRAKGTISIPLSDTLGVVIAGLYRNQDGWGPSVFNDNIFDSVDDTVGRIKFLWQPNDQFVARLGADVTRARGTSQSQLLVGVNTAGASPFGVPIPAGIAEDISTDPFENRSSTLNPRYDIDSWGTNLTMEWDLGDIAFKSITAYREMDQDVTSDFDASRYDFYQSLISTRQDQLSQEFQLTGSSGKLNWLLGAYYFDEDAYHNNSISLGGNNGCLPVPPFVIPPGNMYPSCFVTGQQYATPFGGRVLTNNQQFDLSVEAWALFGHLSYQINDTWSISAGLRWTDEKKTQRYNYFIDNLSGVASFAGFPPIILWTLSPNNPNINVPTTYSKSWSDLSPKLSVVYQANEDVMLYTSFAEGFRSGGFNGRVQPNQMGQFPIVQSYDPETNMTFEAGWKSMLAEDRVRLNGAVFWSQYQDIQLLVLDAESGFFSNQNAAEAEISGVELEFQARPVPQLDLIASLAYLHAEYTKLAPGTEASGITLDSHLPGAPKWSASFGAAYTFELGDNGSLVLRGDYSYRDKVYFNAVNGPLEGGDSFGLLNARLTYFTPSENLNVALYVLNATDKVYVTNGQDVIAALGVAFNAVGAPRTWGVELTYNFGQ